MATTLFALDIGTRSVVGLILQEEDGIYHVADLISVEHKERSMIDGQIHNILSVAKVITEIKAELELRHGPLKRVSVAAAGRALKTAEGSMEINTSEHAIMSMEDVNRLELGAVQQAQQKLLLSDSVPMDDYYYCVGYSVLRYKLDGEEIGSLIDQTGQSASVEVIATFLPRVVVESLLSALKRAELEMEALTLEPIAAINVLIPPSMRRLNVALVDIGAGTSDIAITNDNTVTAYGMVPIAGDEITEALSNHYLLDFPVAELTKRELAEEEVTITDILGFEQQVASAEVITILQPATERLAQSISEEIRRLNNGRSPQAVMVVGGGSLTPRLTDELSRCLELPLNRIGIRGLDALSGVTYADEIESSPALVTPIGIAIAARRAPIHYMSVTVNDKTIRLFELKEMSVGDALLAAKIKPGELYGKPGLGMSVTVNSQTIIIPGEHGTPSTLLVNGRPASTKDLLSNGDQIQLTRGENGADASASVRDLVGDIPAKQVIFNNMEKTISPTILLNGEKASVDTALHDRDEIQVIQKETITDLLAEWGTLATSQNPVQLFVNQKRIQTKYSVTTAYLVGGRTVSESYVVKDGDIIQTEPMTLPTIEQLAQEAGVHLFDQATVKFNGVPANIRKKRYVIRINGQVVEESAPPAPGDKIEFDAVDHAPIVFSDVFAFVEYDLPTTGPTHYQLMRNGEPIGFYDPIFSGDVLEIRFSDKLNI
ncbi:cell division protein [Sporosarcina sp. Te-1]|nr:cell division FtsA domain-containing protein [Sporosarcina sp. Te-1]QTD41389.1 cell division protein [Sporosarcina sp. Te-1]